MAQQDLTKDLEDTDFDEIGWLLERVRGGAVPNAEALDGFLTALVVSPDLVTPGEYMEVITSGGTEDGDLVFVSVEEATHFNELVMRHWNAINRSFRDGETYMPVLAEADDGTTLGNDWAKGFLKGAFMRPEPWSEIMDDEERVGVLVPIFALAHEHDPDPEMRSYKEPVSPELRSDLLAGMIAGVRWLYEFFEPQRNAGVAHSELLGTYRRSSPKVGRNQPCPCGSGKKFKRCCGQTTYH